MSSSEFVKSMNGKLKVPEEFSNKTSQLGSLIGGHLLLIHKGDTLDYLIVHDAFAMKVLTPHVFATEQGFVIEEQLIELHESNKPSPSFP